jgi:hypothetical protein
MWKACGDVLYFTMAGVVDMVLSVAITRSHKIISTGHISVFVQLWAPFHLQKQSLMLSSPLKKAVHLVETLREKRLLSTQYDF